MRILAIHLHNLNSLAGTWQIDFTAPQYAASGIFAITGPTGAGKSTLLDAVCLALFGRTPRLGSITKGSNEIMSRRAGDCFAEVSFATQSGRYRCHWGQHRARRKAGAELQTPRHEMVDVDSGKVLESRSREVVRLVEQVTGMDYERFTRSILLAQGDFAAFLQADADQRAPILEQITGTGIYSRLSMATHERTSEERKKTAVLQEALGSLKLLPPEVEQEIEAAITANTEAAAALRLQQEQVEAGLQRLARIAALKEQLAASERALEQLAEQRIQGEADRRRLERGQRAQPLLPQQTALVQLQEQIKSLEQRDSQRGLGLQSLQQTQHQLQQAHAQALTHLGESQATREKEQQRIKEVRALDLQLHEKNKGLQQVAAIMAQLEKERATLRLERQKLHQQLTALQGRKEALHRFFTEHATDAMLVEQMAGLRQQLLHLEQKEGERRQLQQTRTNIQQHQQRAAGQQQQMDQAVARAAEALDSRRQQQHSIQRQREELLGAQPLPQIRRDLAEQEARLQQLQRGNDWAKRLHALQQERDRHQHQGQQLLSRRQQLQEQLHHLEEQLLLRKQLVRQCEENHQLSLRIRSYEEQRGLLQKGEPCPLCGSIDHPWQSVHPPDDDRAVELAQARAGLEQTQAELAQHRETLVVVTRDLEHLGQVQTEHGHQVAELTEQLVSLLSEQYLGALDTCIPAIAAALETGHQRAEELRTRLAAIDTIDGQLQALAKQIEQAADVHARAVQQAQTNQQVVAATENDLRNVESRLEEAETWLASGREALHQSLHPFAGNDLLARSAQELITALESRLHQWKAQVAQQEQLVQTEGQLVSTLDKQDLQLNHVESQLSNQSREHSALLQQQQLFGQQRHELYGELDPNVEEQRLRSLVQQAEAKELTARNQLAATDKEVHSLNDQQRLDREELAKLRPKQTALAGQLLAEVQAAGFVDMVDFTAALLPLQTLQQLAHKQQQLEQQQVLLTSRQAEQVAALTKEEAGLDQIKPQPELQEAKAALHHQVEALLQRIGADRERLAANARLAQDCAQQRRALADQQREQQRWELLHQLIGSADGKKFRVFAQGLTFEVMVSHANRQLRKMSDRYLLLRDTKEPLNLLVIDNYQAGEIRSTRNLSGGESFLVSLALSLGLSAMASHHVRVDSLFLDEGFGTLDEESLDTALQTLAELQQDGKLIGIISHVPLLRERINLRIQVQPGPDGCSRLVGPGCAQMA